MIGWIFLSAIFAIEAFFVYGLALWVTLACLGYKNIGISTWALLIALFGDAELKRRLRLIDKSQDPMLRLKREIAEWDKQHGRVFVEKDQSGGWPGVRRFQLSRDQAENLVRHDPTYKIVEKELA